MPRSPNTFAHLQHRDKEQRNSVDQDSLLMYHVVMFCSFNLIQDVQSTDALNTCSESCLNGKCLKLKVIVDVIKFNCKYAGQASR